MRPTLSNRLVEDRGGRDGQRLSNTASLDKSSDRPRVVVVCSTDLLTLLARFLDGTALPAQELHSLSRSLAFVQQAVEAELRAADAGDPGPRKDARAGSSEPAERLENSSSGSSACEVATAVVAPDSAESGGARAAGSSAAPASVAASRSGKSLERRKSLPVENAGEQGAAVGAAGTSAAFPGAAAGDQSPATASSSKSEGHVLPRASLNEMRPYASPDSTLSPTTFPGLQSHASLGHSPVPRWARPYSGSHVGVAGAGLVSSGSLASVVMSLGVEERGWEAGKGTFAEQFLGAAMEREKEKQRLKDELADLFGAKDDTTTTMGETREEGEEGAGGERGEPDATAQQREQPQPQQRQEQRQREAGGGPAAAPPAWPRASSEFSWSSSSSAYFCSDAYETEQGEEAAAPLSSGARLQGAAMAKSVSAVCSKAADKSPSKGGGSQGVGPTRSLGLFRKKK